MEKTFVAYEYKEIIASNDKISFMMDGYESFGWKLDENQIGISENIYTGSAKTIVRMKRNRKIINKVELTRLQRHFEACVREIEMLENSKTSKATMYALVIGMLGTAFMAGSVFAVVANPPLIALCILLAIPAFVGWIVPFFVYKKTIMRQIERITPLIEEKYDEICEICEKGSKLLI